MSAPTTPSKPTTAVMKISDLPDKEINLVDDAVDTLLQDALQYFHAVGYDPLLLLLAKAYEVRDKVATVQKAPPASSYKSPIQHVFDGLQSIPRNDARSPRAQTRTQTRSAARPSTTIQMSPDGKVPGRIVKSTRGRGGR